MSEPPLLHCITAMFKEAMGMLPCGLTIRHCTWHTQAHKFFFKGYVLYVLLLQIMESNNI